MKSAMIVILCSLLILSCNAAPYKLSDIFSGYVEDGKLPAGQDQQTVKRQVVSLNPDAELKQISLHGLIGNIENSLFASALSVSGALGADSIVEEVKPAVETKPEHTINKRDDKSAEASTTVAPTPSVAAEHAVADDDDDDDEAKSRHILVQTTKKVPETHDKPAHILIDRVAVQPHNGGVALIPTFQVHHTKLVSATIKEDKNHENADTQTKISITKTSIVASASEEKPTTDVTTESATTSTTNSEKTDSTATTVKTDSSSAATTEKSESTTTTSSTSTSSSTTTQEPIVKLKEEEQNLKTKVAEIEAEPIILSSRV